MENKNQKTLIRMGDTWSVLDEEGKELF